MLRDLKTPNGSFRLVDYHFPAEEKELQGESRVIAMFGFRQAIPRLLPARSPLRKGNVPDAREALGYALARIGRGSAGSRG